MSKKYRIGLTFLSWTIVICSIYVLIKVSFVDYGWQVFAQSILWIISIFGSFLTIIQTSFLFCSETKYENECPKKIENENKEIKHVHIISPKRKKDSYYTSDNGDIFDDFYIL